MLDPACGSMHFGLYAFDLFERIYEEAWDLEVAGSADAFIRSDELRPLHEAYGDKAEFLREVPRLIIERNIYGVDIDPRAVQIAGLSLWLRAQKSWQSQGIKAQNRPRISRSNIVCAESIPGETDMLDAFVEQLNPKLLGQLMKRVFEKMRLAGEAGTLLKIEDEITETVEDARKQYESYVISQNKASGFLPGMAPKRPTSLLDFTGLPKRGEFWEKAEEMLLNALRLYAEQAENGISARRRMFVRDAARGFAFIDLCRNRYDVILMNPPFGASSNASKEYIDDRYPHSKGNVLANFIERTLQLINDSGLAGAISSRAPFFLGSFDIFRTEVLGKNGHIKILADLGHGVLEAMVETAIYTFSKETPQEKKSLFFRLLPDLDKNETLQNLVAESNTGIDSNKIFRIDSDQFRLLHGSPYAYWISQSTIQSIGSHQIIEGNIATIRVGLQTGNDNRFLRCLWEIRPRDLSPSLSINKIDIRIIVLMN
jgi:methylase of polypeptide subunit release factors